MSAERDPLETRDWDAVAYDRVCALQLEWARGVLSRLELRGDESVLDAGCGSGRVTELLVEAVPRGRVIAVDASESMIARARERLGDRADVRISNLLELELPEPVDAVFSNAVFHWIRDHERLFARLAAAMRPGAALEAQCGGRGNVDRFKRVADEVISASGWARHFEGWERPWHFAEPAETERRLAAAGFDRVRCSLVPMPARPPEPRAYIRAVCAGPYLDRLPEPLHDRFVAEVAARLGAEPVLDYVRLNLSARRA